MPDICTDNRFELIEKYKKELIEGTNIETSQDEMAVLDSLFFRFWQMGWLDRLELPERKKGKWIDGKVKHIENGELRNVRECSECGSSYFVYDNYNSVDEIPNYCPNCGADMRTKETDCDYERAVEQLEHDMLYEPTFNQDDGSM